ncbi:MAG: VWA domain-containing protein [Candidatus Krumholzibacteriia bacterium]
MTKKHELAWSAKLDRRLMSGKGGKRHLLVQVAAPQVPREEGEERVPVNLGLVIDASGSMSGEPLEAACEAAGGIVDALRDDDRITVVSFAEDVITHANAVAGDADGKRKVRAEIARLQTRGCTNLAAGWLRGCECVADQMERTAGMQNRVILISDGHANAGLCDPEELGLHAAELRKRGLFTTTVGVGDHYSPTQLQAIADQGGGRMHDAADGQDLVEVLLGELGEIFKTVAQDVTLAVVHPHNLPVTVLGPYPAHTGAGRLSVSLGTLVAGASRQVVLQLAVPAGRVGDRLQLVVEPSWQDPGSSVTRSGTPLPVALAIAPVEEVATELPDLATCAIVARLWQKSILLQTTKLNAEGQYEEAGRYLDGIIDEFRDYCRDLPGGRDLVRELERHRRVVSSPMEGRSLAMLSCCARKDMTAEADLRTFGGRSRRRSGRPRGPSSRS